MLDYEMASFNVPVQFKISKFYTMIKQTYVYGKRYYGNADNIWCCSYIRDGHLCNVVEDKVYNLEKGVLFFYKPMQFHYHFVKDGEKAETFFFSFSFEKFPHDFATEIVYKLNAKQRNLIEKISDFADNAVKNTVFTKEEIALQKEKYINYQYVKPLLEFSTSTTAMATVANYVEELFLDLYNSKNIVEESASPQAEIYKTAVTFMNDNISKKISVPDIAKHCCISSTSLKKVFYKYSNMSIHKYLVKLKINQAILLLESGLSTNEVSQRTGFATQAYFTTAFKRETGSTPRDYLKKFLK